MEITVEDGRIYLHQGDQCIEVDIDEVASLVGRLVRAALEAQHEEAMLND